MLNGLQIDAVSFFLGWIMAAAFAIPMARPAWLKRWVPEDWRQQLTIQIVGWAALGILGLLVTGLIVKLMPSIKLGLAIFIGAIIGGCIGGFCWWMFSEDKSENEPPAATKVIDASSIIAELKSRAGLANLDIVLWSNAHRSLAERIDSAFRLGGWEVNYNLTAQEMRNSNPFTGIEVKGFDTNLVELVARAVSTLGGWDIRSEVMPLLIPKDNPKFPRSQQKVYVTIGYPRDKQPVVIMK